jgi:hypothetical protein
MNLQDHGRVRGSGKMGSDKSLMRGYVICIVGQRCFSDAQPIGELNMCILVKRVVSASYGEFMENTDERSKMVMLYTESGNWIRNSHMKPLYTHCVTSKQSP